MGWKGKFRIGAGGYTFGGWVRDYPHKGYGWIKLKVDNRYIWGYAIYPGEGRIPISIAEGYAKTLREAKSEVDEISQLVGEYE